MQKIYFDDIKRIKKFKDELEKKLNIKIKIQGKNVIFHGPPLDEFEAALVLDALNFGFSLKKALTLKQENFVFRTFNIKDYTRKKNPREARVRVIGTKGRTKQTIEDITNSDIIIKDNRVGIISNADSIEEITTGIKNLVRGTKQSNTYRYLEKLNRRKKLEKHKTFK